MKKLVVLFTALLLIVGLSVPVGAGTAAAAAAYDEISTFVDGKLIITPVKSAFGNSSVYVPVKMLDQIPGITAGMSNTGITVTGSKGSTTLNKTNSIMLKNSNYVAFKTLTAIGAVDGKYASSAQSLFLWTNDEGKTRSMSTLSSISKLPGTMGGIVGKKVYVYGFPGTQWVTDVSYDGGSIMSFTMLMEDGTTWKYDDDVNSEASIYRADYLQYLKSRFSGQTVWVIRDMIVNSTMKNMEKGTILNVKADKQTSEIQVVVRRASGEEVSIRIRESNDFEESITALFWFKNPRTTFNISDKMWQNIIKEKIETGMTYEEVYLAWGEPDRYNESLGYVVYGNTYLYFFNNKLKYIQDL